MHPLIQPYTTYKTKDDLHLVVGVATDPQFMKFCEVLGQSDLAVDPRFKSNKDRVSNKFVLQDILQGLVSKFTQSHLVEQFNMNGVPFSEIESMKSLFEKEETQEMQLVGDTGNCKYVKFPLKFSKIPE